MIISRSLPGQDLRHLGPRHRPSPALAGAARPNRAAHYAHWIERAPQTLTRTSPRATAAYVSVIGHITAAELSAQLSSLEAANGWRTGPNATG
ncbi:MAG: hypothetical protein ACRDX8_14455 [Acidimicrobiales bacterium]